MAEKVQMLALSPTMETGNIVSWLKKEGDTIENGDILCEVETDKATMEYESIQEGILLKIVAEAGSEVMVEETIAIIGEKGEDISPMLSEINSTPKPAPQTGPTEAPQPEAETPASIAESVTAESSGGRTIASPLARVLADQAHIPISSIAGSGPGGRVVKRDIEAAVAGGGTAAVAVSTSVSAQPVPKPMPIPAALQRTETPVSGKRRVIAERLAESKYNAPHFYLKLAIETDPMMAARKRLNTETGGKVSVNAFLMKYIAETIKRHPAVNASWQGTSILTFGTVDIGLAVAQEDGLVTPIVRDCGSKGITEIDNELKDLIARAQTNKLTPEEYTGATFTMSSLGSFGIDEFTAIINPPGSAILAVGAMAKTPVVDDSGEIVAKSLMKVTLSCDHRVIDGAVGGRFLKALKDLVEDPVRALY